MLKDALVGSVFKVTELRTQSQLVTGQTAARLALGKPGDKAVQPTTGADFQPGRQMQQAGGVDIRALADQRQLDGIRLIKPLHTSELKHAEIMLDSVDMQRKMGFVCWREHPCSLLCDPCRADDFCRRR